MTAAEALNSLREIIDNLQDAEHDLRVVVFTFDSLAEANKQPNPDKDEPCQNAPPTDSDS